MKSSLLKIHFQKTKQVLAESLSKQGESLTTTNGFTDFSSALEFHLDYDPNVLLPMQAAANQPKETEGFGENTQSGVDNLPDTPTLMVTPTSSPQQIVNQTQQLSAIIDRFPNTGVPRPTTSRNLTATEINTTHFPNFLSSQNTTGQVRGTTPLQVPSIRVSTMYQAEPLSKSLEVPIPSNLSDQGLVEAPSKTSSSTRAMRTGKKRKGSACQNKSDDSSSAESSDASANMNLEYDSAGGESLASDNTGSNQQSSLDGETTARETGTTKKTEAGKSAPTTKKSTKSTSKTTRPARMTRAQAKQKAIPKQPKSKKKRSIQIKCFLNKNIQIYLNTCSIHTYNKPCGKTIMLTAFISIM